MTKRIAVYTVKVDQKQSEQILNEIDLFFIELEKKYPMVEVET